SLGLVGDSFSDDGGGLLVATVLEVFSHIGFHCRGARKHLVAGGRNDLRVNVQIRPTHHQPVCALHGDAQPRLSTAPSSSVLLVRHGQRLQYLLARAWIISSSFL